MTSLTSDLVGSDDCEADSREFLLTVDGSGKVLGRDARARRLLGIEVGFDLVSLCVEGTASKARVMLERAAAGETVREWELSLVSGGEPVTVCLCARPQDGGSVRITGFVFPRQHGEAVRQLSEALASAAELSREISRQRKELQRQKDDLEAAYHRLDDSNKAVLSLHDELTERAQELRRNADVKSRVVANVSHEFRTPLHTIMGLSRLILDEVDGPLTSEQRVQVQFVRTAAEELSTLVNDLLDLSTIESGKTVLRAEIFSVDDFLAAMRGMLRALLPASSTVSLELSGPPEEVLLETDKGKLSQITRNLVSNAIKFTEQGSVNVDLSLENGDLVLVVRDTGIGIRPEDQERIFEEFTQIDGPLQSRARGTGLGLPLARKLAHLLGGELDLTSEPGVGSTFTLVIPRVHPEVREIAELKARPLEEGRSPVLVVEDDRKTVFLYEKYLSQAGFQVLPARSVREAEEILQQVRPAAIVLDIMLEGEASWSFLATLKQEDRTKDIPVLVVTVTNREDKARALGADEFWLKPIDQDRLLRKLDALTRTGTATRILMIDDDEGARYLVRRYLESTSFTFHEAETGEEGVAIARQYRPHIILLDFLLRGLTAFDVIDELKADPLTRSIPVIIVTSHVLGADERKRLSEHTETILSKQNLSRELAINRIRDALRKAGVKSE